MNEKHQVNSYNSLHMLVGLCGFTFLFLYQKINTEKQHLEVCHKIPGEKSK